MADNKVQLIIEALDRTKGAFKEIGRNLEGLRTAALSVAANIATIAAPFIALGAAIKATANAGEEYLKVSKQMGISVENISTLKYAAEQSEASFEDLTSGMKFFSKALYGVNDEGKDTTVLLKQLGVTAKDPYQALLQTADAFSEMEDGSGKAAIAMHLFGRGGLAMIPMLNEGSAGIKKLQGEVKEFSTAAAKAGDDFNDNLNRLKRNIMDIVHSVGNDLIPILNELFDIMSGKQRKSDIYLGELIEKKLSAQQVLENKKGIFGFLISDIQVEGAKKQIQQIDAEMERILAPERKKPEKKKPATLLPAEGAAATARERIDAALKVELEGLKLFETQRLEAYKTEEKELELKYAQGLLSEKEYQAQVAAIKEEALSWSIVYAEKEKELIQQAFEKKEWLKKEEKDSIKAKSDAIAEQRKRDDEIEQKQGERDRLRIQSKITEIELEQKEFDFYAKLEEEKRSIDKKYADETAAEIMKLADDRLKALSDSAENTKKAYDDIAIERETINKGELAGKIKQYDIETTEIWRHAQEIIASHELTAEQILQVYDEASAKQLLLDLKTRDALLANNGTLVDGLTEGFRKYTKELRTTFQHGVEIARQTAQAMESAFSDFFFDAFQGKMKSLADYLKSFLTSVQRALANALGQQVTGSIISSLTGLGASPFGSSPQPNVSTSTPVSAYSSMVNLPMHSGGLVMHEGGYIPRFHFGGLSSDEVPAILQRGEYVVSRKGVAAMDAINQGNVGGGPPNVSVVLNVQNNTGIPVQAREGGMRFNGKQMVKEIILELKRTDPGFNAEMARG